MDSLQGLLIKMTPTDRVPTESSSANSYASTSKGAPQAAMQKTLHTIRRLTGAYGAVRLGVRVQGCLHVGRRRDDREVRLHGLAEAAHVLLGGDDGGLLQGHVRVQGFSPKSAILTFESSQRKSEAGPLGCLMGR